MIEWYLSVTKCSLLSDMQFGWQTRNFLEHFSKTYQVFRLKDSLFLNQVLSSGKQKVSFFYFRKWGKIERCNIFFAAESLSRVSLFVSPWTVYPTRLLCLWDFSGRNTGVGCHFLLPGIFPTQGLNSRLLCLLHCRQILDPLSQRGSIYIYIYTYVHYCRINWNFVN